MSHQYRPSGGTVVRGDTWGIVWNVPGEHHGNGNSKQQHCNTLQSVNLVQSNYHIEEFPYRSFCRDRTKNMRNTEEGEEEEEDLVLGAATA
ncbi:hypothetical protein E2C01_081939 [Portunus trituberculatus]|uniref:Uncharacterized protein n=1 Tax=Portunus trituberculatus TaxID=210409 RepID=A0A5B7J2G2_PORTR|nr:hypothetical protein [Portunus trituberculatus]